MKGGEFLLIPIRAGGCRVAGSVKRFRRSSKLEERFSFRRVMKRFMNTAARRSGRERRAEPEKTTA